MNRYPASVETLESRYLLAVNLIRDTQLVVDSEFAFLGDTAYFAAAQEETGVELWKAQAGNDAELVADLVPGKASSKPRGLTALGEKLLLVANSADGTGVVAMLGFGSGDATFRWFEVAPVPEPSGFLLGALAFPGLLLKRDHRHR